ncbi:MAG TPA: trypsin-like peptidase domain-containing protein [Nocardioidaceae bacterium]|nr:trypsin-like peptidase domain-containing protein [Nocardioidaceae bacterium]
MNGRNPHDSPHHDPHGPHRADEEQTAVFPHYPDDQRNQQPYGASYPSYGSYGSRPGDDSSHAFRTQPHADGPGGYFPPAGPSAQHSQPPKAKRGFAIVVAAVLAGAVAGFGGSAGYLAVTEPAEQTAAQSSPVPSTSVADSPAPAGSVEAVAQAVLPSVVKIDVAGPSGSGSGSGIILTSDGTIVTNNHVVAAAAEGGELAVSFNDGSTAEAEIVGRDPVTDIAVIQAQDVSGLTPADLGSSDTADVGEQVVAVGSPFGLESTVTSGIVSALGRTVTAGEAGAQTIFPAIQTDAAINPGNSGGALVNMRGEVIGINSAIRSTASVAGQAGSIGLGFAIPIDEAKPIIDQLAAGEVATHARLGVTVGTPTNEDGLPDGAQVRSVVSGSAADEAGLQEGDIITKVGDTQITSSEALVAQVRSYRPGDSVQLTVLRDGDSEQVQVTLGSDEGQNNT